MSGAELEVTCSIGCAWVSPDSEITPEVLLKQADTALYGAKGAGRNQAHYVTGDQAPLKL
jgi:PleD family two-component response regulator